VTDKPEADVPEHQRADEDADKAVNRIRRGGGRVIRRQSGLEVVRFQPDGETYDYDGPYL
jgi:hypothetical protein